jgi:hypothetical protein
MKAKKPAVSKRAKSSLRTSPKDVFLHLLMMVMLYIGVISLIALSFAYIEYSFPDQLSFYRADVLNNIRMQSSMLVVSFPLLLILASLIQRDVRKTPAKHELKFSKWLIYLTLFLSALTIVIDLIQLVNRFYSGELTTPFLLKVLSVLVVAGGVFGYYMWDVQNKPHKSKVPVLVAWITSVVVVGMLALGFFIAGSPSHQRDIRLDEERVNDLSTIQYEVINYWRLKDVLPENLSLLENDLTGFRLPADPETEAAYEYRVTGDLSFELCAVFKEKTEEDSDGMKYPAPVVYDRGTPGSTTEVWSHEAGRHCFSRTIDPDLYPDKSVN